MRQDLPGMHTSVAVWCSTRSPCGEDLSPARCGHGHEHSSSWQGRGGEEDRTTVAWGASRTHPVKSSFQPPNSPQTLFLTAQGSNMVGVIVVPDRMRSMTMLALGVLDF